MSKETYPTITRRNVLAGIGATGAGLALGAHGAAAGEKNKKNGMNNLSLPVAIAWQEAVNGEDIDAFPDDDDGSIEGPDLETLCLGYDSFGIEDPRSSEFRTSNSRGDPIIDLPSVTQGDRGEATLYFQSCSEDLPAGIWLKIPEVHVDKKLQHNAMARVWYDLHDEDDGEDAADFGDNVHQEEEPIIAQGSLKHVLKELKGGVRLDADPHVAVNDNGSSVDYQEGVNYFAYPHNLLEGTLDHEPGWITDDNVKQHVEKPKVHEIQNLSAGAKLFIPGEGYVGGDEESPLPDLEVTLTDIIRNEQGEVAGFRWSSNLPLCRIELDTGSGTEVNTFNGATEGEAMAVDDDGNLLAITGFQFGVCSEEELECFKPGEVGAIGFEWWIPDGAKLGEKTKMKIDFDFKAKPCPPEDVDGVTPPVFCGCGRVCSCESGTVYVYQPSEDEIVEFEQEGPFCATPGDADPSGGQIVAVEIDGTTFCNPNQCAETGQESTAFENEVGDCDEMGLSGGREGTCSEPLLNEICETA